MKLSHTGTVWRRGDPLPSGGYILGFRTDPVEHLEEVYTQISNLWRVFSATPIFGAPSKSNPQQLAVQRIPAENVCGCRHICVYDIKTEDRYIYIIKIYMHGSIPATCPWAPWRLHALGYCGYRVGAGRAKAFFYGPEPDPCRLGDMIARTHKMILSQWGKFYKSFRGLLDG